MKHSVIAVILLLFAASCSDDSVDSKYSDLRASFTFYPVTSAAPLNAALNGYGEYCTIQIDANHYYFRSLTSSVTANRTDVSAYQTIVCIGGFIVGRSALNEIGSAEYPLVCYDLVCSNCYRDDDVAKALSLEENGRAVCSRCSRTYDLNNGGIISMGNKGKKLFRYRMSYGSNTLAINN